MMKIKHKKLFVAYISFSVVVSSIVYFSYSKNILYKKDNVTKCDQNRQRRGGISVVEVKVSPAEGIRELIENCYDISNVTGEVVTIYASREELESLKDEGFSPKIIDRWSCF